MDKRCYQCDNLTSYLFDDGRCSKCTRLTPEEVKGVAPPEIVDVREYPAILHRKEYPMERGYRMEWGNLPAGLSHITITETTENKYLTVYSRIHVNKEVRMHPSYSLEFSDYDIIRDLSGEIHHRFG